MTNHYLKLTNLEQLVENKNGYYERKIYTEIMKLTNQYSLKNGRSFDKILISFNLCSIIMDSKYFLMNWSNKSLIGSDPIGWIQSIPVFLDPLIHPQEIHLKFNSDVMRNNKISTIIEDESELDEVILELDIEYI